MKEKENGVEKGEGVGTTGGQDAAESRGEQQETMGGAVGDERTELEEIP